MFTIGFLLGVIVLGVVLVALPEKTILPIHRKLRRTAKNAAAKIEDTP